MPENQTVPGGFIVGIVRRFLSSQLSIILIVFSLCVGVSAVFLTPREEDPQIVVPLADVYVQAPGASPSEIEKLVATPLERLLWQIDGVEDVYSVSGQDAAIVTVRFFVGEDRENSLVKLHNKISMNIDAAPPIVKGWVIKPVEIDDVPIVNLTLHSNRYNDHELRRIGEEILSHLAGVKDISRTEIVGGLQREIRVEILPECMAGFGLTLLEVYQALQGADASVTAGKFTRFNREFTVAANAFFSSAKQVSSLLVGVDGGRPIYLSDIAEVIDGPEEAICYSRIGYSHYDRKQRNMEHEPLVSPAVTLALAKKKGTNAVAVSRDIQHKLKELQKSVIPEEVHVDITRNYGQTAQQKVNELLSSLVFAIITVVLLLAFALGWREALVVALAVPISFSLALFVNFLFGYTINRVTLFALILSLGLVVDDPITNVDNIQRHILRGKEPPDRATLFAVKEVLPPVIMSTLAIIASFSPLFFITGMMGPYMAPMAANVPVTVIFSTICALTIVPWLTHLLLKKIKVQTRISSSSPDNSKKRWITQIYRRMVSPLLESKNKRNLLFFVIVCLFALSMFLVLFRAVPLKMLPFDNKNEFQIVVDMPEGTSLETTDRVVGSFEDYLRTVPEITNFVSYVGTSSPIDFNGLVRHYYLRKGSHLADIRINLVNKNRRRHQCHEIVLRLRKDLEHIAGAYNANIKIVEVPPGPPVLSTIVAEIYGEPEQSYAGLVKGSEYIKNLMESEPFVVDIDDTVEAKRIKIDFILGKEKAALHGISTQVVMETLRIAVGGVIPATVHEVGERQSLNIKMILPREKRSAMASLSQIPLKTATGRNIPLAELVHIVDTPENQPIYHKNLQPVVYVMGEMAGRAPAEAVIDMQKKLKSNSLPAGLRVEWAGEGEWKITLRVFRDMGIAFAAALVGIYILLIIETNSFFMPVLIMMAIPLTLIGALPGFWLLNLLIGQPIGGFENPVFFTATSMIGMIALGGIVIRNSLVLIEFIQDALKKGTPLKEAILQSGAIRMRPILLTAATTALGVWPITFDPIFSGLAWTLIFGLFASTVFSLVIVPITYFSLYKEKAFAK
ncbi:MAG: efflux RND transporter permease subunit [Desulfobacterales bacterium]|nr:efflux RND transporter permease subunit [Desulfobacterales bacterium]